MTHARKMTTSNTLFLFLVFVPVAIGAQAAERGVYPSKPVRFIVPQSAGGSTDLVARPLAQRLSESLRQTVVVDNRPGAGSVLGTDIAAKAVPDGYTLLAVAASFTMSPSLHAKLPFDPVRDFAPISLLSSLPNVLVVHPSLPVKSVKELVALARARPGFLNFGSSGVATGTHMSMELFRHLTGVDMVHVPYKGGAPSMTALIGGEVKVTLGTISTALPHVKSGRLRALAVSTAKRAAAAPEIPTIAESGVPGFDYASWIGILAPAGTPSTIVARLHAESVKIVQLPEMRTLLASEGSEPVGNTPKEFGAIVQSEVERWKKVAKAVGVKAE